MVNRPNASALRSKVANQPGEGGLDEAQQEAKRKSDAALHHLQGIKDFYDSRKTWSIFLICCIALSLIFQITLTFLVGKGILNFVEYKWFLPIIVSENFIQIVALATIVLKWLFSGPAPNKMLEHRD